VGRFLHNVKPNHSSETIHNLLFVDVETDQIQITPDKVQHQLREGVACYQQRDKKGGWRKPKWCEFTTRQQFYTFFESVQRPKTKLYVWCHNSNFDYPVLDIFSYLSENDYKLQLAVISGPPTIMRYRKNNVSIIILDTLNIWRVPLATLGKIIGINKFSMPNKDASRKQWLRYNRRDVEIIRKAVTDWADFLKANDFGGFAPTLAGQSMRLYRHRFMTTGITLHDNESAMELERNCYHGGRNEAYKIGKIKNRITVLDINSMYPSVMASEQYPIRLKTHLVNVSIKAVCQYLYKYVLCAKAVVQTDTPAYPVVQKGKLVFPVGRFECYITTPEIRYAIEHNHLLEVKELAMYEKGNIFSDFVNYLYDKRMKAETSNEPTDSYLYKILLNSHYGKWGQKGYNTVLLGEQQFSAWKQYELLDTVTGKIVKYRQLGKQLEEIKQEGSSREAFPAIAAHVTAYARMKLWELIEHAKQENVYYCDTDSIICNDAGVELLRPFMDDKRLGALKNEGSYTSATIWGCKDYKLGTKERHKGVKRNAQWITNNTVKQQQWQTLRGMLRQGHLSDPITKDITKTLHRNYTKGIVSNTGDVTPISLP